jgi:hypothetical protein
MPQGSLGMRYAALRDAFASAAAAETVRQLYEAQSGAL